MNNNEIKLSMYKQNILPRTPYKHQQKTLAQNKNHIKKSKSSNYTSFKTNKNITIKKEQTKTKHKHKK